MTSRERAGVALRAPIIRVNGQEDAVTAAIESAVTDALEAAAKVVDGFGEAWPRGVAPSLIAARIRALATATGNAGEGGAKP